MNVTLNSSPYIIKRNLRAIKTQLLGRAGFIRSEFARQQMVAKNLTSWEEVLLLVDVRC